MRATKEAAPAGKAEGRNSPAKDHRKSTTPAHPAHFSQTVYDVILDGVVICILVAVACAIVILCAP